MAWEEKRAKSLYFRYVVWKKNKENKKESVIISEIGPLSLGRGHSQILISEQKRRFIVLDELGVGDGDCKVKIKNKLANKQAIAVVSAGVGF